VAGDSFAGSDGIVRYLTGHAIAKRFLIFESVFLIMNGVYFVFGLSVILTILAACFEIIRRDVVSDYIGFFFGFLVIGLVILWVYRQIVEWYAKRSHVP